MSPVHSVTHVPGLNHHIPLTLLLSQPGEETLHDALSHLRTVILTVGGIPVGAGSGFPPEDRGNDEETDQGDWFLGPTYPSPTGRSLSTSGLACGTIRFRWS